MDKSIKTLAKSKSGEKKHFPWKRFFVLFSAIASIILAIWFIHFAYIQIFRENPRYKFRNLVIDTHKHGYWEHRQKELTKRLNITPGKDNIFQISPYDMRAMLLSFHNLADAEVKIVLPDTVKVSLTERIPRAIIDGTNFVIDENCIIFDRRQSASYGQIPRLYNCLPSKNVKAGNEIKEASEAMTFIMTILQNTQNIDIISIKKEKKSYRSNNRLQVILKYMDETCILILPANNEKRIYNEKLTAFLNAITKARNEGDNRSKFRLDIDGQVILQ